MFLQVVCRRGQWQAEEWGSLCLLEVSQASPARPSGRSSMKMQMKTYQAEGIRILTAVA